MNHAGMPPALAAAIEALGTLPGIGPKSAMRMALHLLQRSADEARALGRILEELHEKVGFCEQCGAFAEGRCCRICADERRDGSLICVVEQPVDVLIMERGGGFSGRYHVLHGRLSPVDGMMPESLRIGSLERRVGQGVRELILATSATVDGEATAHYLARRFHDRVPRISRIARGVPEGGELEYLDEYTLQRAIDQRVVWE